ncbi:hypothetical protein CJD36_022615 [Flavipsychrobacter stenotrophus]|uniref:Uncharacterized protein n=1 Tax=Flavipsychrobacter stenotrophus TaxID=2077091 RepID=A0A2S7SPV9_9BACT|nr:hypothetical protein [Flavipsychrobacter stenotrophus]PQJ08758.1 hypothetical protein CJD36_022615 [Flavipsychrobacter stenotrophus]
MKTALKLICLLFCCNIAHGQNNLSIKAQVDSIRYLKGDAAFDCNSVIWRIIAKNKEPVPYLIALISDSTTIPVPYRCKREKDMNVGDMAYYILDQILTVPLGPIAERQFHVYDNGCLTAEYDYIEENRSTLQGKIQKWYAQYKDKLIWCEYTEDGLTDCRRKNNIVGYYLWVYEYPKPVPEKKEAKQKKK